MIVVTPFAIVTRASYGRLWILMVREIHEKNQRPGVMCAKAIPYRQARIKRPWVHVFIIISGVRPSNKLPPLILSNHWAHGLSIGLILGARNCLMESVKAWFTMASFQAKLPISSDSLHTFCFRRNTKAAQI
jgi:hypothetical protein